MPVLRFGDVVLKRTDDVEEAEWCAAVLETVVERGFRVGRPVRTLDGRWVAGGWTAFRWVSGTNDIADVPRPALFSRRQTRWAVADRVAWGEAEIAWLPALADAVRAVRARLRPVSAKA